MHSGDVVFAGTRVPVAIFVEHLEAGGSIDDFLIGHPTVAGWQVEALRRDELDLALAAVQRTVLRSPAATMTERERIDAAEATKREVRRKRRAAD